MLTKILTLVKTFQTLAKNRELLAYLFFGVCTTLVNTLAYRLLEGAGIATIPATAGAWFIAVIFAFFTNRKYVFGQGDSKGKEFVKQLLGFFAARIFTGILDIVIMYFAVDVYGINGTLSKLASNIIVIVLNYFFSKLLVFRKRPSAGPEPAGRSIPAGESEESEEEAMQNNTTDSGEQRNTQE